MEFTLTAAYQISDRGPTTAALRWSSSFALVTTVSRVYVVAAEVNIHWRCSERVVGCQTALSPRISPRKM
jgi:hypothetical protein